MTDQDHRDPPLGDRPEGPWGDDEVSRLYRRLPRPEPPARVDAEILTAARRAVGARPVSRRPRLISRWIYSFSTAAMIVLSVSLVTLVKQEAPGELDTKAQGPGVGAPMFDGELSANRPPSGVPEREGKSAFPEPAVAPLSERQAEATITVPIRKGAAPRVTEAEEEARWQKGGGRGEGALTSGAESRVKAPAPPATRRVGGMLGEATLSNLSEKTGFDAGMGVPAGSEEGAQPIDPETGSRSFAGDDGPADWLDAVRRLYEGGERDQAGEELALFLKRYPDYPRTELETRLGGAASGLLRQIDMPPSADR